MSTIKKHLIEEFEKLREQLAKAQAELFALRGELGSVQSGSAKVVKFHRAEIKALKAENQTLRNAQKACEDCDAPTIGEFKQLKAENARLAAAFENIERMVQRWGDCQATYDQLIVEFARLRAAREGKAMKTAAQHNAELCGSLSTQSRKSREARPARHDHSNKKPWVCDECGTPSAQPRCGSGGCYCGVGWHRRRAAMGEK